MKISLIALTLLASCFSFAGPIESLECRNPKAQIQSVRLSFLETHQMATLVDISDGFYGAVASCGILWQNNRAEKIQCAGYYMESLLLPANVSIDLLTKKGTLTTVSDGIVEIVCD